jgi:hypothetical protein
VGVGREEILFELFGAGKLIHRSLLVDAIVKDQKSQCELPSYYPMRGALARPNSEPSNSN